MKNIFIMEMIIQISGTYHMKPLIEYIVILRQYSISKKEQLESLISLLILVPIFGLSFIFIFPDKFKKNTLVIICI